MFQQTISKLLSDVFKSTQGKLWKWTIGGTLLICLSKNWQNYIQLLIINIFLIMTDLGFYIFSWDRGTGDGISLWVTNKLRRPFCNSAVNDRPTLPDTGRVHSLVNTSETN